MSPSKPTYFITIGQFKTKHYSGFQHHIFYPLFLTKSEFKQHPNPKQNCKIANTVRRTSAKENLYDESPFHHPLSQIAISLTHLPSPLKASKPNSQFEHLLLPAVGTLAVPLGVAMPTALTETWWLWIPSHRR
jgi:hypothetical protein